MAAAAQHITPTSNYRTGVLPTNRVTAERESSAPTNS